VSGKSGDWRRSDYGYARRNLAATASSILVSTLATLLRSSSDCNAAALSGVNPHVLVKSSSAVSGFLVEIGASLPPIVWAMNTIRTVQSGNKSAISRPAICAIAFSFKRQSTVYRSAGRVRRGSDKTDGSVESESWSRPWMAAVPQRRLLTDQTI